MSLAGNIADKASSLLGDDKASDSSMQQEAAVFEWGQPKPIDENQVNALGWAAHGGNANVHDYKMPLQFIHFGKVHTDAHDLFNNSDLDDTKADALKDFPSGCHAIAFRAALQREAILLDGFIGSFQQVLTDCEGGGALNKVMGAATSLLSGGGKGGGAPDAAQLDPYKKAARKAGGKANAGTKGHKREIQYKNIHQSGIDLHQVRTNYCAFGIQLDPLAPKAEKSPDKEGGDKGSSDGGGGLLGNLPGKIPIPPIPGVDDASKVIDILFKMFEIYRDMFYQLREQYEPAIEKACYERSMNAIRERHTPIFDVWSIQPNKDQSPKDHQGNKPKKTGVGALDGLIKEVHKDYSNIKNKIESAQQQWREFWETAPPPGPGQKQLESVFSAVPKPEECVLNGFSGALDGFQLPVFIEAAVVRLVKANVDIIHKVFVKLQDPAVAKHIDEQTFLAAGRLYLADVIHDILNELLPAFQGISVGSVEVTKDMGTGKVGSVADDLFGKNIKPILHITMDQLYDRLSEARTSAAKNDCDVMEVYLALLPQLIALSTRNTFFPIWQIVVDQVFAHGDAAAMLITSPVNNLLAEGRSRAADAKDTSEGLGSGLTNDVDDVANDLKGSTLVHHAPISIGDDKKSLGQEVGDAATVVNSDVKSFLGIKSGDTPGSDETFPGSDRQKIGSGKPIDADEWNEVNEKQDITPV